MVEKGNRGKQQHHKICLICFLMYAVYLCAFGSLVIAYLCFDFDMSIKLYCFYFVHKFVGYVFCMVYKYMYIVCASCHFIVQSASYFVGFRYLFSIYQCSSTAAYCSVQEVVQWLPAWTG